MCSNAGKAAVCIGEQCEYMHKNVCFRVPAPSPRGVLPRAPCMTPFATAPSPFFSFLPDVYLLYIHNDERRSRRRRVCMHGVKMSSDLERASRMLTFPARRGMITLTTYISARERNHVSAPPFYSHKRQSMRMLDRERSMDFVLPERVPVSDISIRVTFCREIICQRMRRANKPLLILK